MLKRIFFLLLIPVAVFGQNDPQTSVNYESNPYFNPAFMVNEYRLNVAGEYRNQWVGFDGGPVTAWASASYEIDRIRSTFGLVYLRDEVGAVKSNDFRFNYAFRFTIRGEHHLVPAIYLGMVNNSLDGTQFNPMQQGDPNIISTEQSANVFDMGLGLSYRFRELVLGVSMNHLNRPTLEFNGPGATSTYTIARSLYVVGRYDLHIGKLFRLMPKAFFRTDFASFQLDAGIWLGFDNLSDVFERLNIGAAYRIGDAVVASADLQFKWFTLGYAYDITTSSMRYYSNGSHQAYLRVHLFRRGEKEKHKYKVLD